MKGWKVGQAMTYSEIERLIRMVRDEIKKLQDELSDTNNSNTLYSFRDSF
jgi:hypothetical protein